MIILFFFSHRRHPPFISLPAWTFKNKAEDLRNYIAQAFATTRQAGNNNQKDGEDGDDEDGGANGNGLMGVGQVGNLADVLASMQGQSGDGEQGLKGRFAHVTEFGQEAAVANAEVARLAAQQMQATEEEKKLAMEAALAAEAEAEEVREQELADLQRSLEELVAAELELQKFSEGDVSSMRQLESQLAAALAKTDELEKEYLIRKKALEMLPDANNHIAKLQDICGKSAERLVELGAEWETHRIPMVATLRKHKEGLSVRKETCRKMVEEMKSMREEMKGMAGQVRAGFLFSLIRLNSFFFQLQTPLL
jgi:chromosome segregation ATPase